MANLVNSLLSESAKTAHFDQFSVANKLAAKWQKSGLLKGLNENDRSSVAVILENQAKQLVVESSQTNQGGANFTAGNDLDFQYGNNKTPFGLNDSLYGTPTANFGNAAAGGLYGAGKFGYSLNQFSASVTVLNASASNATFADVRFDSSVSASIVAGEIKKVAVPTASLSGYDVNAIRSFVITSGSKFTSTAANLFPAFTEVVGSNVVFYVTASSAEVAPTSSLAVFYNKATDFNSRGDFEDRTGLPSVPNAASNTSIVIPEINVQMKSQTISAKTRKLKAQWTPEFAQDLNAYHSLDAEAELTGLLSEHISLEIDLEVLDMLINAAPTVENWSAKVGNNLNAAGTGFEANTAGVYYTQMSWFQTIGIKLQKVSNIIHQRTMRGGANFMVVSPAIATILESIPGFAADSDGAAETMKYAFGVQKIGALNSRYKVYKNPYMTENIILMGYKGGQFLECGAVYSPYVPLIMTPLIYDPNTFTPRKGIMTRYAMTMIRPEFYGLVQVSDLNIV